MVIIMILNTGSRTDIPAYYSEWFMNRIHEGLVMARNPYYPKQVYRFSLDPKNLSFTAAGYCCENRTPLKFPAFDQLFFSSSLSTLTLKAVFLSAEF